MSVQAKSDLKLWFPAMDNGVIDAGDVASGYIYARINYAAEINDTVNLYLDNQQISSTTIINQNEVPYTFSLEAYDFIDGNHMTYYKVTDQAGNSEISEEISIYVDKTHNAPLLPPPTVDGGDDLCITQEEYNKHNGLMIYIPGTATLSQHLGSTIYLKLIRYTPSGTPVNNNPVIYKDTIDLTIARDGLTHTFPDADVQYALSGKAILYYCIEVGTDFIFSEQTSVEIGNCDSSGYIITLTSDRAEIYADGNDFAVLTASVRNQNNQPVPDVKVSWTAPGWKITHDSVTDSMGLAKATVSSTTEGMNNVTAWLSNGSNASVTITSSNNILHDLPAPQFPQSNGSDYILSAVLKQDGQLAVEILYPDMTGNDVVTLNTTGYLPDGSWVQQAFSMTEHPLTLNDISAQKISLSLPSEYALSVTSGGIFLGNYIVSNKNIPANRYSQTGLFRLDHSKQCIVTTGSPVYDVKYGIYPANHGVVYGNPGAQFSLSCTGDAYFSNNTNLLNVNIDNAGEGKFNISSSRTGETTITGVNRAEPQQNFNVTSKFDNYLVGSGNFHAARCTSNAPADGTTPNSLYVIAQADKKVSELFVQVDGDAQITGGGHSGTFSFNASQAVSVDIVKLTPGSVNIILSLPEAPGEEWSLSTSFV